jgi:hypothetical protein
LYASADQLVATSLPQFGYRERHDFFSVCIALGWQFRAQHCQSIQMLCIHPSPKMNSCAHQKLRNEKLKNISIEKYSQKMHKHY